MQLVKLERDGVPIRVVDRWHDSGCTHGFCGSDIDLSVESGIRLWEALAVGGRGTSSWRGLLLRQMHGKGLIDLTGAGAEALLEQSLVTRPEADGWVFSCAAVGARNLLFGVLTADCFPVLLRSSDGAFGGVLHCGWRSACKGILLEALRLLSLCGVEMGCVEMAIGPGAGQCCYEVGSDVAGELTRAARQEGVVDNAAGGVISIRQGRFYAGIGQLLRIQARSLGVADCRIVSSDECTICGEGFFSHRRQNALSGRQVSFVGSTAQWVKR